MNHILRASCESNCTKQPLMFPCTQPFCFHVCGYATSLRITTSTAA